MFNQKLKDDIICLEEDISHFRSQLARVFGSEVILINEQMKEIENSDLPKEMKALQKLPLLRLQFSLRRISDKIDKISLVQTECSIEKYGKYPRTVQVQSK